MTDLSSASARVTMYLSARKAHDGNMICCEPAVTSAVAVHIFFTAMEVPAVALDYEFARFFSARVGYQ